MNSNTTLTKAIEKLRLTKIVASFLLATILFLGTAFSSGSAIAASNKSATTYPTDDGDVTGLLYSDSDKTESIGNDFVDSNTKKKLLDPAQIPAVKQPILDRSDPDAKLLEKTKQMFDDAGDFSAN